MRAYTASILAARGMLSIPAAGRRTICSQCLHSSVYSNAARFSSSTLSRRGFAQQSASRQQPQSSVGAAYSAARQYAAEKLSGRNTSPTTNNPSVDPLRLVASELKFLKKNIRQLLGSGHPVLDNVAKYYTNSEGKQIRPLLVLLMSQATSVTPRREVRRKTFMEDEREINEAIGSPAVLADANPDASPLTTSFGDMDLDMNDNILPCQRRLAEIIELIHTASLLHDDVIDNAVTRRSESSANVAFGNKMAVLAGDFLLGRASVALARLRDPEVTELIATVIANLIEGEFMQLKNTALDEEAPVLTDETITYYLQKTYLKSASLISKSCRASALLGQCTPEVVEAAYLYGRNLGLAFQLVDDMLDYTINSEELGKPAGADLELGLATAPLLYAWKQNPELGPLVGRRFSHEGDVQLAKKYVLESDGLEQTRALAQQYANDAIKAIEFFPDSEAKQGLIAICKKATSRRK